MTREAEGLVERLLRRLADKRRAAPAEPDVVVTARPEPAVRGASTATAARADDDAERRADRAAARALVAINARLGEDTAPEVLELAQGTVPDAGAAPLTADSVRRPG